MAAQNLQLVGIPLALPIDYRGIGIHAGFRRQPGRAALRAEQPGQGSRPGPGHRASRRRLVSSGEDNRRTGSRSHRAGAVGVAQRKCDRVGAKATGRILDADHIVVFTRRGPDSNISLRVSRRLAGGGLRLGRILRTI